MGKKKKGKKKRTRGGDVTQQRENKNYITKRPIWFTQPKYTRCS